MGPTAEWMEGLTPTIGTSEAMQIALDWWHLLPIQDLMECKYGWANLCMKYHPERTECYHFTEEEILFMYQQEITQ